MEEQEDPTLLCNKIVSSNSVGVGVAVSPADGAASPQHVTSQPGSKDSNIYSECDSLNRVVLLRSSVLSWEVPVVCRCVMLWFP